MKHIHWWSEKNDQCKICKVYRFRLGLMQALPDEKRKERSCLNCGKTFLTTAAYRICDACKYVEKRA